MVAEKFKHKEAGKEKEISKYGLIKEDKIKDKVFKSTSILKYIKKFKIEKEKIEFIKKLNKRNISIEFDKNAIEALKSFMSDTSTTKLNSLDKDTRLLLLNAQIHNSFDFKYKLHSTMKHFNGDQTLIHFLVHESLGHYPQHIDFILNLLDNGMNYRSSDDQVYLIPYVFSECLGDTYQNFKKLAKYIKNGKLDLSYRNSKGENFFQAMIHNPHRYSYYLENNEKDFIKIFNEILVPNYLNDEKLLSELTKFLSNYKKDKREKILEKLKGNKKYKDNMINAMFFFYKLDLLIERGSFSNLSKYPRFYAEVIESLVHLDSMRGAFDKKLIKDYFLSNSPDLYESIIRFAIKNDIVNSEYVRNYTYSPTYDQLIYGSLDIIFNSLSENKKIEILSESILDPNASNDLLNYFLHYAEAISFDVLKSALLHDEINFAFDREKDDKLANRIYDLFKHVDVKKLYELMNKESNHKIHQKLAIFYYNLINADNRDIVNYIYNYDIDYLKNVRDKDGKTFLHHCFKKFSEKRMRSINKQLRKKFDGFNLLSVDNQGKIPFDYSNNNKDILDLTFEYGKKHFNELNKKEKDAFFNFLKEDPNKFFDVVKFNFDKFSKDDIQIFTNFLNQIRNNNYLLSWLGKVGEDPSKYELFKILFRYYPRRYEELPQHIKNTTNYKLLKGVSEDISEHQLSAGVNKPDLWKRVIKRDGVDKFIELSRKLNLEQKAFDFLLDYILELPKEKAYEYLNSILNEFNYKYYITGLLNRLNNENRLDLMKLVLANSRNFYFFTSLDRLYNKYPEIRSDILDYLVNEQYIYNEEAMVKTLQSLTDDDKLYVFINRPGLLKYVLSDNLDFNPFVKYNGKMFYDIIKPKLESNDSILFYDYVKQYVEKNFNNMSKEERKKAVEIIDKPSNKLSAMIKYWKRRFSKKK